MKLFATLFAAAAAQNTCANSFWEYDHNDLACEPTATSATVTCGEQNMTIETVAGLYGDSPGDFTFTVGTCPFADPSTATSFDFTTCGSSSSSSASYSQIEQLTLTSTHTSTGMTFFNDIVFTCNINLLSGATFEISVEYGLEHETAYVVGTTDTIDPSDFVSIALNPGDNVKVGKQVDWVISSTKELPGWTLTVNECKITSLDAAGYTAPANTDFVIYDDASGAQSLVGAGVAGAGGEAMGAMAVVVGDLWAGHHVEFQFANEPDTGMNHQLACTLTINKSA